MVKNTSEFIRLILLNGVIGQDEYKGSGTTISRALKKYGLDNFDKTIICISPSEDEAYAIEEYLIRVRGLVKDPNYYNLKEGGIGGFSVQARINAKSPEARAKKGKPGTIVVFDAEIGRGTRVLREEFELYPERYQTFKKSDEEIEQMRIRNTR